VHLHAAFGRRLEGLFQRGRIEPENQNQDAAFCPCNRVDEWFQAVIRLDDEFHVAIGVQTLLLTGTRALVEVSSYRDRRPFRMTACLPQFMELPENSRGAVLALLQGGGQDA
jgi:hypothetical protein